MPFVKDRLLRADFCPSLLLEFEHRTEEEMAQEQEQIGVLYYKVIHNPIDLETIKHKLDCGIYVNLAPLEKDMLLMLSNARKFASEMIKRGMCGGYRAHEDATALLAALRQTVRTHRGQEKTIRRHNNKSLRDLTVKVARDLVANVAEHERGQVATS